MQPPPSKARTECRHALATERNDWITRLNEPASPEEYIRQTDQLGVQQTTSEKQTEVPSIMGARPQSENDNSEEI